MIRLAEQSDKNSPASYDAIFNERAKSEPNWQDIRRWKTLLKYYKGGSLLDMGCLDSNIHKIVDKIDGNYLGIDMASKAIEIMSGKFLTKYGTRKFLVRDLYDTRFFGDDWENQEFARKMMFDCIVFGEVLEHLERPTDAIKEAFRVLKSGGVLAISVPLEEVKEIGAVDKERHLWSFTKQDIKDLIAPYSKKVKTKVLRSKWWPKYKYCWPQLLVWAWKK